MPRRTDRAAWDTKSFLEERYTSQKMSTQRIAAEVGTFPNTIRRALKRHGIVLRDKSEAQSFFLEDNDHPMLGRERTEEEKLNISAGIQKAWDTMSPEEKASLKEKMSEQGKLKWEWMDEEKRQENLTKMQKANRDKAGEGSHNENLIAELLIKAGYKIVQRTNDFSPQNLYEIDIAIPSEAAAIEWDGAAHFEAIYGEDSLKRTMAKDEKKNKALTGMSWTVIRCRDHSTSHSLAFCKRSVDKIIAAINTPGRRGQVINIDMD